MKYFYMGPTLKNSFFKEVPEKLIQKTSYSISFRKNKSCTANLESLKVFRLARKQIKVANKKPVHCVLYLVDVCPPWDLQVL
jgi:hypothetical protein